MDKLVHEFEERTLQKTLALDVLRKMASRPNKKDAAKAELVELLMPRLQPQLKTQLENWLEIQLLETIVQKPDSNPFTMRFSDYTRLPDDEKNEFHEKIYMENYDWIESELDRRKAERMIVVNGQVVKSSSDLNKVPLKPQLDRLGKKKGFVPFLFVRNIPLEESKATEPRHITNWSRVSINTEIVE